MLDLIADGASSEVVLMAGQHVMRWPRQSRRVLLRRGRRSAKPFAWDRDKGYDQLYRQSRMKRLARVGDAEVASAIITDATMRIPCIRLIEAQRKHQPSYHYIVTWSTPAGDGAAGAIAGIELGFVFGTHEIDQTMQPRLVKGLRLRAWLTHGCLTQFAKTVTRQVTPWVVGRLW